MRVVEDLGTGALSYMAADQICVELAEGVDDGPQADAGCLATALADVQPQERVVVLGVLHTGIDAVPATLAALEPWSDSFLASGPDWIEFKQPQ